MSVPTPARTVSASIHADPARVYDYVVDPRNLAVWAAGLAKSVEQRDGQWYVDSGAGEWIVAFADRNTYGVADHVVTQPDGSTQLNPMRVLPNGDGAEVTFTLFRAEATSDEQFNTLADTIQSDLHTLRDVLEGTPPREG